MGYHKVIDGTTLDGELFTSAEDAVRRNADRKISLDDAQVIYENVIDGGLYTKVEEDTVEFLLRKMQWRTDAREWFLRELAEWQAREMKFTPMSSEEVGREHFSKKEILEEEFDRAHRETALRAATMATYDNHEEIALIVHLADGRRVQVKSNFVELEDDFVEIHGGVAIPLRAIERVEF